MTWKAVPLEDGSAILKFDVIESIQRTPPLAIPTYEEKTGWSLTAFWLLNNFKGKKFVDNDGNLVGIQTMKGGVDDTSPEAYHQVDGISGATMTGKGLNIFLMNDLRTYES